MKPNSRPILIQEGMGVGVSAWQFAKAVPLTGQLGVVAGTALDAVLVRRLQCGDPGGHMRRAFLLPVPKPFDDADFPCRWILPEGFWDRLLEFPLPRMAKRILARYFLPRGNSSSAPLAAMKFLDEKASQEQRELIVLAKFADVFCPRKQLRWAESVFAMG